MAVLDAGIDPRGHAERVLDQHNGPATSLSYVGRLPEKMLGIRIARDGNPATRMRAQDIGVRLRPHRGDVALRPLRHELRGRGETMLEDEGGDVSVARCLNQS